VLKLNPHRPGVARFRGWGWRRRKALVAARAKSDVPKGWRLVPAAPTSEWIKEMCNRGEAHNINETIAKLEIEAALAAAPEPPG